jgi:hypothetical protein
MEIIEAKIDYETNAVSVVRNLGKSEGTTLVLEDKKMPDNKGYKDLKKEAENWIANNAK